MQSEIKQPVIFSIRRFISKELQRQADETIASFPTQLKGSELDDVNNQIGEMYGTGIWQNSKSLAVFSMNDEDNSLHDWIRRLTMLNVGSPSHIPKRGWLYNGTDEYTDSVFTPSTGGLLQDSTHVECFCYENLDSGNIKALFGSDTTERILLFQEPTSSRTRYYCNTSVNSIDTTLSLFQDMTRYGVSRVAAASQQFFEDGAVRDSAVQASEGLPTKSILIGANNAASVGFFLNARVAYIHKMISPNFTPLNTNLTSLESKFIV